MEAVKERAEKHAAHGVTGFELCAYLLQNLYKYKLSPTAKNVLWYLSMCHNGQKGYVFPKQKTIAEKIRSTERSVIRAIQELVKEGLIVVECNVSNKYFWGPKIASECPHFFAKEKMSAKFDKISSTCDKMSHLHVHEQTKEERKEQTEFEKKESVKTEDYKILKDYAVKNGAKNIQAYINTLKKNGSAESIILKQKEKFAADRFAQKQIKQTEEMNAKYSQWIADNPNECEAWVNFKKNFAKNLQ